MEDEDSADESADDADDADDAELADDADSAPLSAEPVSYTHLTPLPVKA